MSDKKQGALKSTSAPGVHSEETSPKASPLVLVESTSLRKAAKPVEKTPELVQRVIDRVKKM